MDRSPPIFLLSYGTSCLLDALDGYAARLLDQGTKFGAVLDMVTDRATTAGLLCYLCTVYPKWMLAFQLLNGLDLSSHYMHMYASLSQGATSHKAVDRAKVGFFMWLYYTSRPAMFVACAGNELFYICLYLMSHNAFWGPETFSFLDQKIYLLFIITAAATPIWAFKQLMNVIQMIKASRSLAQIDSKAKKNK